MTKLPGADDWPDQSLELSFHDALARRSRALRRWVGASPRRALSADGMTLFVARRHGVDRDHHGKFHVWSDPTEDGEASMFVVDVFHADADATGYYQSQQLAPEVEVLSLDCGDGVLHAVLRLPEDQRVALELSDATVDVAWPREASGGLAREVSPLNATASGYLLHLAELLAVGGVAHGTLAREAMAQRRERDGREQRRTEAHRSVRERVEAALARSCRVEELGLPQTHAFDQAVARAGLGMHREALRRWARPCWALIPGAGHRGARLRGSRLGGVPDLPRGMPWPAQDGKLLHFISQINLAELPALTGVQMPRQGLLSLFTGMLEPADDVEHLVLYTPGGIDTFPTSPPSNNYRDEQVHIEGSLSLLAEAAVALPGYDSDPYRHLVGRLAGGEQDRYFELQDALAGDPKKHPSRMLGYPDAIGVDPEATAFFRRAGRPDSRFWLREELETDEKRAHFDYVHERLDEITAGFLDWVPLFRIRSYSEIGVTFWDAGTLDVMIHRDDLAALRFDRTVAVIASS